MSCDPPTGGLRPGAAYALHVPASHPVPARVERVVLVSAEEEFATALVEHADSARTWEDTGALIGTWADYQRALDLARGARGAGVEVSAVLGDRAYGRVTVHTDLASLTALLRSQVRVGSTSVHQDPGSAPHPPLVVAVDGPSGSGKSTVCRRVAEALGARYLDTGAMYRALTWWALERGTDLADTDEVARLAREMQIELGQDPAHAYVVIDGTDVTGAIRETRISEAVSTVAGNLGVRAELVRRQQALVAAGDVVAEGRDITTVVAPQAPVRILLTAREHARLARRAVEVHGTADEHTLSATRDQVLARDERDSRVAQFLRAADEGVVEVDSSDMGVDETVAVVLELVARRTERPELTTAGPASR